MALKINNSPLLKSSSGNQSKPDVSTANLSQIFISSNNDSELSDPLKFFVDNTRAKFINHTYRLFNDQVIQEFIAKHYSAEVLQAYMGIKPFAFKADLARYCIIYELGGWYIDLGILWNMNVTAVSGLDLIVFKDRQEQCSSSWAIHNGAFWAKARHPALATAIDSVVHNYKRRYYGVTSLCPTGPNVFGSAIAKGGASEKTLIGKFIDLTPDCAYKNTAFVFPDGKIAAFYKPGMIGDQGRLIKLQQEGTNDYNDFYSQRNIYGESEELSQARDA